MSSASAHITNRDRFYSKIQPIFEGSRYDIRKSIEGKYKDKIIQIINKGSGTHDFHVWCHIKNDRLDLIIPTFRIHQIPENIDIKGHCKNIKDGDRLDGQDAVSFQEIDEDVLIVFFKFITTHVI